MRKIDIKTPQGVALLRQLLRRNQTTAETFRLDLEAEECAQMLSVAYDEEVKARGREMVMDDATASHIRKVSRFLTEDTPRFGFILMGTCGNGKTTLARAVRSLLAVLLEDERRGAQWVEAKEIARMAKADARELQGIRRAGVLIVDDLGEEPAEVLQYGNALNPAIDLLTARYNERLYTIITSNLTPDDIRTKYGARIADRFNEMFDRVIFENPTYRTMRK